MRTPNLKFILETILEDDDQPKTVSPQVKQQFLRDIANFSELGQSIYGRTDLEQTVNRVKHIVDRANDIMAEKDSKDKIVGFNKTNKRLREDLKDFEQAARELHQAQQHMTMCYENIGQHLSKYFDVN
jgi:hypothetical protein